MAVIEALKNRTLAGANVSDSNIGALDVSADGSLRTDEDRPWLAVYTDSSSTKETFPNATMRSFAANGQTILVFEFGIASSQIVVDPETGLSNVVTGIPATDDAFEMHADIVARQIGDALLDPDNQWAEIFRLLVQSFKNVERLRTSSDTNGVRLAAQQIRITADLVADPVRGQPLKDASPLKLFFDKCETDLRLPNPAYPDESDEPTIVDPVIAAKIELMRAQIGTDAAPFDWQTIQRRFGLTGYEADALMIKPPAGVPGDATITDITPPDAQPVTHDYEWHSDEGSPL
ncbi:hypothetical protein [Pseudochelatococcus sp. G4_1912]|uniref:hypothetical protein n=1 Tax=Pseudochelatococcus sp. G4_1912 TaxID=3114288 RepID=UPI0039C743B2